MLGNTKVEVGSRSNAILLGEKKVCTTVVERRCVVEVLIILCRIDMKLEYSTGGIDDETMIELVNFMEFNLVVGNAVLVERITLDMVILQYLPVQ